MRRSVHRWMVAVALVGVCLAGAGAQLAAQPDPLWFQTIRMLASGYINWGATGGSSGYGLRDNAGTIEVKPSGGAWSTIAPATAPTFPTTIRVGAASTYDGILVSPAVKGAGQFDLTLSTADLTAARAINFPNLSGVVALVDGGQTFTSAVWDAGAVRSSGLATFNGAGTHTFSAGLNGQQELKLENTTSDTVAEQRLSLYTGAEYFLIDKFSAGYTTGGTEIASSTRFYETGTGGISLVAAQASAPIRFFSGGTTLRGGMTSAGILYAGTAAAAGAAGDVSASRSTTAGAIFLGSDGNYYLLRDAAGNMTIAGGTVTISSLTSGTLSSASGVITSSSDERLKDISPHPFGYGLKEVLQLNPIRYHWNAASGIPTAPEYGGFGAGAVEKVMPLAVSYGTDGMRGLNDRVILGAVVNAIKTQDAQLRGDAGVLPRLVAMEREIADLKATIKQLEQARKPPTR